MAVHAFNRGGQSDGTLTVSLDRFYGEDYVLLDAAPDGSEAHLTADGARALAADLVAHADSLDGAGAREQQATVTAGVGDVLTGADPEPAVGTLVRDDCGARWGNVGDYWVPLDAEGDDGDPESWAKIAGNYGPVTVIRAGRAKR